MEKQMDLLTSVTGVPLEMATWIPQGERQGVVQIVHGMAEHLGRYEETAQALTEQGFILVCHNHLGHGETAPVKGYFAPQKGWDSLLEDVDRVRKKSQERYPGLPYYMLGHSMGSFVLRCYLQSPNSRGIQGAIISGTGYFSKPLAVFAKAFARLLCSLGYSKKEAKIIDTLAFAGGNKQFAPVKTPYDWTSRDEEKVAEYAQDPLCGFVFTGRGYYDLFTGIDRLTNKKALYNIEKDLPLYFFSGDLDPVGKNGRGVKKVYNDFLSHGIKKVTLKLYPKGRHEMLNEINRKEVVADLVQWLNDH